MWQINMFAPDLVVDRFCIFMEQFTATDEFRQYEEDGGRYNQPGSDLFTAEPCLLDLVGVWLKHDRKNVEDEIHSYAMFMAGLVMIINGWLSGDKRTIDGYALWPDPKTGEPRRVEHLLPQKGEADRLYGAGSPHFVLNQATVESYLRS